MFSIQRILVATGLEPAAVICAAEKMRLLFPGAEVETFHLEGGPSGELLDEMLCRAVDWRADLIVVGARRHVTASRTAMLAPCSVLMVPDEVEFSFGRILAPVDFSDPSSDSVRIGYELARAAGVEFRAAAVESDDEPWLPSEGRHEDVLERLRDFATRAAGPGAAEGAIVEPLARSSAMLRNGSLSPAHRIEGADIASTIVAVARRERASLIVMGTRGRTRSASVLLGSVTEKTIQLSPVPVLAVKRFGAQMGLLEGLLERLRQQPPIRTS